MTNRTNWQTKLNDEIISLLLIMQTCGRKIFFLRRSRDGIIPFPMCALHFYDDTVFVCKAFSARTHHTFSLGGSLESSRKKHMVLRTFTALESIVETY